MFDPETSWNESPPPPPVTQQRANRFHLVVKETPHQSHLKPEPANDEKCVYCGGEGGGRRRTVSPSKPRAVLLRYSSLLESHNGGLDIYFKSPAHADIFPRPSFGQGQPENIKWCLHTFL